MSKISMTIEAITKGNGELKSFKNDLTGIIKAQKELNAQQSRSKDMYGLFGKYNNEQMDKMINSKGIRGFKTRQTVNNWLSLQQEYRKAQNAGDAKAIKRLGGEIEGLATDYDKIYGVAEGIVSKSQLWAMALKLVVSNIKHVVNKWVTLYRSVKKFAIDLKDKLLKNLKSISHVLRYMILRMTFRALIKDFGAFFNKAVLFSDSFREAIDSMYTSLMRLNAGVISAIAPVLTALAPMINAIASAVQRLLDVIAQFNAYVFMGSSEYMKVNDFLINYSDGLDEVGGSAKKASKQLAAFDTIMKLSDSSSGSGAKGLEALSPSDVFSNSPVSEHIKALVDELNSGYGSILGQDMYNKFKEIIDKGLSVFDEKNFKTLILPKVQGVRNAISTFLDKINNGGTNGSYSYKFGTLASSIVNDVADAINTAFGPEEDGTYWYEKIANSIGLFLAGAVDRFSPEKVGECLASIKNAVNRFWSTLWAKLGEEDQNGVSTADKIGKAIGDMFVVAAKRWDADAAVNAFVGKINTTLDVLIGILKGRIEANFIKGNKLGQSDGLADKLYELGGKLAEVILLGFADAMSPVVGFLSSKLGIVFDETANDGKGGWKISATNIGETAVSAMSSGFMGQQAKLTGSVINAVSNVTKDSKKDVEFEFEEIGGFAIEGFKTGVLKTSSLNILKEACTNVVGKIKEFFTKDGDEEKGGLGIHSPSKVFEEIGGFILQGLANGLSGNLDTSSFISKIISMKDSVVSVKDSLISEFSLVKDSLFDIFDAIGDMFKTQMVSMVSMLNITMSTVESGLNRMVSALNDIISDYNAAAEEVGGRTISYVGRVRLSSIPIPKLATGAVIPPNNPFLAVLGDNRKEEEFVSPLSTMKQALKEAMVEVGYGAPSTIVMELDDREFGRAVMDLSNRENRRVGVKMVY